MHETSGMNMASIQLFIILFSFALPSKIQIISQNLDLSDITIGDKITYILIVEHDKDVQLLKPEPISIASEHFETEGPEVKQLKGRAKGRGKIWELIEYQLTVYEPGTYSIPPIIIKCLAANGREFSVISQPMEFKVRDVKPKGARTIRDIKGPESAPKNIVPYILILGILIVVLGVASYFYLKNRRQSAQVKPDTIILQRLPHEIALEELREIELMDLVAKGEIKEYYIRISEVIRRYIEKRYGIAALEMTTAKLLDALQTVLEHNDLGVANKEDSLLYQRGVGGDLIGKIGAFLNACDAVKFAKYQPNMDEANNLLQKAREIIELDKK